MDSTEARLTGATSTPHDSLQHSWRDPPPLGYYVVNLTRDHAEMVEQLKRAGRLDDTLWDAVQKLQRDEAAALHERHQLTIGGLE